jgi:DHA1 family tetracycline resistance protein-like MFS transporter
VALDMVSFGMVVPLLPLYAERYHASPTTIGLLMASFSVAQLVLAPVWGRVSDRVGRKPVLLACLAGTTGASLLTGLAGAMWVLFVARALDGASGASVSVAQAAVSDVAAADQRARLLGYLGGAFGIGFVAGPAIAGLAALAGARTPFLLAAGLGAVNLLVAARRVPETHEAAARPAQRRWRAWRDAGIVRIVLVSFLGLVAFSAFEATFSLFGHVRLGFGLAATGGVFALVGLLVALAQFRLVAPVVGRWGEPAALRAGLILNAAGLLVLAAVHSVAVLVVPLLLLAAGQALITPTVASLLAGRSGEGGRGAVLGFQQSAGSLARVVGPAFGGAAFGLVGVAAPYLMGAAVVAGAAVASSAVVATAEASPTRADGTTLPGHVG